MSPQACQEGPQGCINRLPPLCRNPCLLRAAIRIGRDGDLCVDTSVSGKMPGVSQKNANLVLTPSQSA